VSLRLRLILITTAVVTVLFGVSEWLNYQQTGALLDQHEAILRETADHAVALERLRVTRERMFLSTTKIRIIHAVGTLVIAVAILNYVWFRVIYRPIHRLLSQINIMGRGTWTTGLPVRRNDEIGELTRAFNDLGPQLTSTFEHIHTSSKLSALALIGSRLVREVTAARGQITAVAHTLESCKAREAVSAITALATVETQLRLLEEQFQSDFDQQVTAMSGDRRTGSVGKAAAAVVTAGVMERIRE
jgi:nitrogen fixation/metabolism regulation signal transduction histidine kinase